MTADEWRATVLSKKPKSNSRTQTLETPPQAVIDASFNLPSAVNWTAGVNGVVADVGVKDQGQCGSCWAFATIGTLEGSFVVGGNKLTKFSEQQIVSCDKKGGNSGCNGGDQITALKWIAAGNPICTEVDYPYTSGGGKDGKCETTCKPAVKISSGYELKAGNETELLSFLATQPVSLSVDASNDAIWQDYAGGVVTQKCSTCTKPDCLDHGVTGVGYGSDSATGTDYYIVKNSWGTDWGLSGYILLARGDKYNPSGQCGVQIDNQIAVGASPA
jgi:C1A family cysteine protease